MKKILAMAIALLMVASLVPFTVAADGGQVVWETYAGAQWYHEENYAEDHPDAYKIEPGYKYTADGIQMTSPSTNDLFALASNAFGSIQSAEKLNITDGFNLKATVQAYEDDATTDKWISFNILSTVAPNPGSNAYGQVGFLSLIRPTATNVNFQSFIVSSSNAMHHLGDTTVEVNIYEGGELNWSFVHEGDVYKMYLNDVEVKFDTEKFKAVFTEEFDFSQAYVGITMHNGSRHEQALTITEFNGVKPAGSESKDNFPLPEGVKPLGTKEDTLPVPEGEPCYIWKPAEDIEDNKPGAGMTSELTDAGTAIITFDGTIAPQLIDRVDNEYWYDAAEFPIFAIKYKTLDEIGAGFNIWYQAGTVYAAQNDSVITGNWADGDIDVNDEENGWLIVTVDLSYETRWEDRINGFRLDLSSSADAMKDMSCELAWVGLFRTELDAYKYAGLEDTYYEYYGDPNETEAPDATTEAPAGEETTEAPAGDATTEAPAGDESTKAPTTGDKEPAKNNTWIFIVIGAVAVVVIVVVVIVVVKKKK